MRLLPASALPRAMLVTLADLLGHAATLRKGLFRLPQGGFDDFIGEIGVMLCYNNTAAELGGE